MNRKFKSWLLGIVSLFAALTVSGCGIDAGLWTGWTGDGYVVEKEYEPARKVKKSDGTFKHRPECHELEVQDSQTYEYRDICVSKEFWLKTNVGTYITVTKESYK